MICKILNLQINKMFTQYKLEEIQKFYSKDPTYRYQSLIDKFFEIYGQRPTFIARAPGRVNIIGQHIDYQGYGVFPSAIEKDCLIAVKLTESQQLQIHHFNEKQYPMYKTEKNQQFSKKRLYANKYLTYMMAGYRAGIQHLQQKAVSGLQLLITGDVPLGSGVSSSAALVVCSALSSYYANKQNGSVSSTQFIESCISRQKQCGVASGGMDQSISVMGKLDSCLYIQFHPIRCEKVVVPAGCKLIIMNSLVENLKSNTAVHRYNKRVVECRLALFLLSHNLGIKPQIYRKWKILKQLQQNLKLSLEMSAFVVEQSIQRKKYTKQEIQVLLGSEVWELLSDIQLHTQVLQSNQHFNLYQAALHVFTQSQRVLSLIQICNSTLTEKQKNKLIGKLMNQSHQSCSKVYQCSCQELDQLVRIARENGALGSRLTGAGWGGCTVSLVQDQMVEQFMNNIKLSYYAQQPFKSRAQLQGFQNVIFQSKPSEGACIITL